MILHTLTDLIQAVPTLDFPEPSGGNNMPGADKVSAILGVIKFYALGVGVAGIIIAGARMAISHGRGDGAAHIGTLGWAVAGIAVVAMAVSIVGFVVS